MSNETQANGGSAPLVGVDSLKKHKMSFIALLCLMYSWTCGGPFGIENMVSTVGPGMAIIVLMVFPFFFSVPQGLIASELGSAIPAEGGYYVWIRRAFGEFWAYQSGWWRTISCYVDSTLYVVLAVGYFTAFWGNSIGEISPVLEYLIKAGLIIFFTIINIRGLGDVGKLTTLLTVFVVLITVVFVVVGFANWEHNPVQPVLAGGWSGVGLALVISVWLYSGYESMGMVAGEMENPQLATKAILLSLPLVVATYVLPTLAGMTANGDWESWAPGGSAEGGVNFVDMSGEFGVPGIMLVVMIAAMLCNLTLYNSYLASGSRGFFVLADDNLCPKWLAKVNKKHGAPHVAILSMAIINLVLVRFGFETLVVIDVFLFIAAYLIWFIAGIALRYKEPNLKRPFKVPGGNKFLIAIFVAPILICVASFFINGVSYMIGGTIGVLTGPITYIIFKRRYGGLDNNKKMKKADKRATIILTIVTVVILVSGIFMYQGYKADAETAFNDAAASSQIVQVEDISYDLEEDTLTSGYTFKGQDDLYMDIWLWQWFGTLDAGRDFGGYAYIEEELSPGDFANKVFIMVNELTDAEEGFLIDYAEFEDDAGNYFYIEYGEAYGSPSEIEAAM